MNTTTDTATTLVFDAEWAATDAYAVDADADCESCDTPNADHAWVRVSVGYTLVQVTECSADYAHAMVAQCDACDGWGGHEGRNEEWFDCYVCDAKGRYIVA